MFLGDNLVTWGSKKQTVVVRSSAEAKFKAIAHGFCEMFLLKIILDDLRIKRNGHNKFYCANKYLSALLTIQSKHEQTKHAEIDRQFIKKKIKSGLVRTQCVPSCYPLVDL